MWHAEDSGAVNGFAWNVAQNLDPGDVTPWARALFRERLLNFGKDSPMARCLPRALPPLNSFQFVFARIVQTPALTLIVYEGDGGNDYVRTIFTDGRPLPENPSPTWFGYSVGRWEADTLVVTTSGFNDRGWLDFYGHPQTESLRITERFRRRDVGHMDYEMTIDDPADFARPFSMRMNKILAPDSDLQESICENEKDARHIVGGSPAAFAPADLSAYTGVYQFSPGRQVTVRDVDGFLLVQEGANGMKRILVPQSDTVFVFRDNGDSIRFVRDTRGHVNHFIVSGRGSDQVANRK